MLGTRTYYDTVRTEAELRKIMGTRSELLVGKQLDRLDRHCRAFVALSPFALVSTCDSSGACDVSPSQAHTSSAGTEANGVSGVTRAVLAAVFAGAGVAKLAFRKDRLRVPMPWVEDFSQDTVRLIGALELLGAMGVVAPRATGVLPRLAPLAAAGLAMVMVGSPRK